MRVSTDHADVGRLDPLDLSFGGHHEDLVLIGDAGDPDHLAVSIAGADIAKAFAAAFLRSVAGARGTGLFFATHRRLAIVRIGAEVGSFAVAVFADGQQRRFGIGDDHADDAVLADQRDPFDAGGIASHRACIGFAESNRHSRRGHQDDFIAGADDGRVDQLVAFAKLDRDDATAFAGDCIVPAVSS